MSSRNIYNSHLQLTFVHCKLIITQISEYATPKLTFVQICERRIKRYKMFYANLQKICAERDTNVTQALKDIGHSDGCVGRWKRGALPTMAIAIDLANHLHVSLDELAFGKSLNVPSLSDEDKEWLSIIHSIPVERQQMCKDFLKTHMVQQEKYIDKKIG